MLTLRIEGVAVEPGAAAAGERRRGSLGSERGAIAEGKGVDTAGGGYGGLMGEFERRMEVLRRVVEAAEGRRRAVEAAAGVGEGEEEEEEEEGEETQMPEEETQRPEEYGVGRGEGEEGGGSGGEGDGAAPGAG